MILAAQLADLALSQIILQLTTVGPIPTMSADKCSDEYKAKQHTKQNISVLAKNKERYKLYCCSRSTQGSWPQYRYMRAGLKVSMAPDI